MSPETARHRAALRLAFAATLAMVWGTMIREPLPGLTAVLAAQILVGIPRPPRPRQAAALVAVIAATAGIAFAVSAAFSDRLLILMAALGLLFFTGFALRERAAGRPSLPATMLLNATAVVPVLTVQADILGAGVIETRDGAGVRGAYPRQGRHRAAGPTLLRRRAHCARLPGAARARHLPDCAGSGGRARPTRDSAAGQPRRKRRGCRRLCSLGDRSPAARTDANGAARLAGLRGVDHDRRASRGWCRGADRPRDLSDALWPRRSAHPVRHPGSRSDRRYRPGFALYGRSDHSASAAARPATAGHHGGRLGTCFVISIIG